MIVECFGKRLRIPKGYVRTEDNTFVNGHGVEYGLVAYGRDCEVIGLEPIYSEYSKFIEVEVLTEKAQ